MSRDLRLLAGIAGLSAAADLLVFVALTLHVHGEGGGPFAIAALAATTMVPQVLLAPVGGVLCDRFDTGRVLVIATAAQAMVVVALASAPGLPAILALSAAVAAGNALAQPAEFALVPVAARGRDITRVNGLVETSRYVGFAAGPVLAGMLAATGSLRVPMAVAAAGFAVIAVAASLLGVRRPARRGTRGRSERAREGVRHLVGDPVLRPVVGATVAALLVISVSITAEVIYLVETVGASPAVYGPVLACWTLGMAAGALGVAGRIPARHQPWAALVALAVQGAGMAGQTVWAVVPAAVAGYLVGGVGHGVKNTLVRTVMQRRVPAAVHGRAFAAYSAARNTAELAATALAGVLVAAVGARAALAIAGLVPIAAALAGLLALRAQAGLQRAGVSRRAVKAPAWPSLLPLTRARSSTTCSTSSPTSSSSGGCHGTPSMPTAATSCSSAPSSSASASR